METRNVTLTLNKAKEFYNSGNEFLKEIALQAFTEKELTVPKFTDIKTLEDAKKALGIANVHCSLKVRGADTEEATSTSEIEHLEAIYKVDIILRALNGSDWKPKMTEGYIYSPFVTFYPSDGNKEVVEMIQMNNLTIKESFIANGKKYFLVGGDSICLSNSHPGIGCFCHGHGEVNTAVSLLGCKSEEIAQHMSKYFAKEIFEACYAKYIGLYKWV